MSNTAGGGTLIAWGENSKNCELIGSHNVGVCPISVHASATRATKTVTGTIQRTAVTNITTDANLKTTLVNGIDDLTPGFIPVHNGTAWNYWFASLADNAASSFTPPSTMGIAKIINDYGTTTFGIATYNTAAGGATCDEIGVGANFEVTTGALAGTTGTDAKVTFSAHTDGKVYLENRDGNTVNTLFTILFQSVIFGL